MHFNSSERDITSKNDDNMIEFFPKENHSRQELTRVRDLALNQLHFLAAASKDPHKSIFIDNHLETLKNSRHWACVTITGLKVFTTLAVIATIGQVLLALVPTSAPAPNDTNAILASNSTSSGSSASSTYYGVLACVAAVGVYNTITSYWTTGWAPHFASHAANKAQNVVVRITKIFDNLALRLLRYNFSFEQSQAQELAKAIDLTKLNSALAEQISDEDERMSIFGNFQEAVEYINTGNLPENELLLHFIRDLKMNPSLAQAMPDSGLSLMDNKTDIIPSEIIEMS